MTAILHRGLRNDFFFLFQFRFTFSNFYFDFYFPFLFGLLFPFFFGLSFFFFSLDFYFPFSFGLLFPFSLRTFTSFLFPFFLWTFIQSWSNFGSFPNLVLHINSLEIMWFGMMAPQTFTFSNESDSNNYVQWKHKILYFT